MDLLSEITIAPSYRPEAAALLPAGLRAEVDAYMAARQPASFLATLKQRLLLPQHETLLCGTKYSQPLLNALVFYVGIRVRPPLLVPYGSCISCSQSAVKMKLSTTSHYPTPSSSMLASGCARCVVPGSFF